MIISTNLQRALKVLHLLAVSFWIGGCLCELILAYVTILAEDSGELFGLLRASQFISVFVISYLGAWGSFFTGLAYSMCTNRGFFRHKWIIIKWISTIYLLVLGLKFHKSWGIELLESAQRLGYQAIFAPSFLSVRSSQLIMLSINLGLFVVLTILSVWKPWEVKESIHLLNKKLRVEK